MQSPYIVIFAFDLALAKKVCAELHASGVKCRHVDARSFTGVPEQGAAVLLGSSEELKMAASTLVRDKHPGTRDVLALGQITDIAQRVAGNPIVVAPEALRRGRPPRPAPADTPVEHIPAVDPAKQA